MARAWLMGGVRAYETFVKDELCWVLLTSKVISQIWRLGAVWGGLRFRGPKTRRSIPKVVGSRVEGLRLGFRASGFPGDGS